MLPSRSGWVMLIAASSVTPMRIWAENPTEVGFSLGLVVWAGLLLTFGVLIRAVAGRLGVDDDGATGTVFWLLLATGAFGRLSLPGEPWTLVLTVGALVLTTYRLRTLRVFRHVTVWAAAAAVVTPLGLYLGTIVGQQPSQVARSDHFPRSAFTSNRDVVVLVFDAWGSARVLEEFFGADAAALRSPYLEAGLTVADRAHANYPLTHYSIASFFEMSYPVAEGARSGRSEWNELLGIINGDNRLVQVFKSQGYEFTMVESGWSGIRCSRSVDRCIHGEWVDEATGVAIDRSLFGELLSSYVPNPTASGTLHSISFLEDELGALLDNDHPDLVFAHLMIPHPPMFIDDRCEYRWDREFGGKTVGSLKADEGILFRRKAAYLEQVACVQSVILGVSERMGDGILVAIGDHGPDSRGQLFETLDLWDAGDLRERFGVSVVTNAKDCGMGAIRSLVNVGRQLLGCLTDEPVDLLEDRFFLALEGKNSVGENTQPVVEIPAEVLLSSG